MKSDIIINEKVVEVQVDIEEVSFTKDDIDYIKDVHDLISIDEIEELDINIILNKLNIDKRDYDNDLFKYCNNVISIVYHNTLDNKMKTDLFRMNIDKIRLEDLETLINK